jgi:hypothetical protein
MSRGRPSSSCLRTRVPLWLELRTLPLVGWHGWLHCHLHRPTNGSWQERTQSLLTGIIPSYRIVLVGVALDHLFGEVCEAPVSGDPFRCWPSRSLVDRIFYGELRPYRMSLSNVKVIMMIMRALVVELLCQTVIGRISGLESLSPHTHGRRWICLTLCDIKWTHYPRIPVLGSLARYW